MADVGAEASDIWDAGTAAAERSLWNARLFPCAASAAGYAEWLWMLNPGEATDAQKLRWREVERYSVQEMATLADQDDFFRRRWAFRGDEVLRALGRFLWEKNSLSAVEIGFIWENLDPADLVLWCRKMWQEALGIGALEAMPGMERLVLSRIVHTLASAIEQSSQDRPDVWKKIWPSLAAQFSAAGRGIIEEPRSGHPQDAAADPAVWCRAAKDAAFLNLSRTIVRSAPPAGDPPRKALRGDEIVWGRAPARLDLGGGWTDTPPYTLENGGCVINAAVDLNGQPPIQVYARVIPEPEIRISSIDHGTRVVIATLDDLLDYRVATSTFGLAKAALALSGFCPSRAVWPGAVKTLEQMLTRFGGGIELTTLAAIPSGSGLGTSSIMGAVLMSVIARVTGVTLSHRELFHAVLQLEQELTTGGGWQDQIGGTLPGVKTIATDAGLVPNPRVHSVPDDLLDPAANDGRTLLYYTGMRRLAKNILRGVVGKYLDRGRGALYTLGKLQAFPPEAVEALSRKDIRRFGQMIDLAWRLNKQLDPESSNAEVEGILARFKPYMLGAKLLGAGGGGFLLIVCETAAQAAEARRDLTENPPNPLARFFGFSISRTGLEVTVC
jgi:galactokinase/mevalonate kinase-like predicted kinase